MGEFSMEYGGVDLAGSSYGVTVLRHKRVFLPESEIEINQFGQRHGGYADGGWLKARVMTVPCVVNGSSQSDVESKLDALRLLMDPSAGDQSIQFDSQTDRYWLGRLSGVLEQEWQPPKTRLVTLRFVCADPVAWASSETTINVTLDANPKAVNTAVIGGTTAMRPVWTFQNTSGGAVSTWKVSNTTTGEVLTVSQPVVHSHYIRFDSQRERVETSTDGNSWAATMSGISMTEAVFPRLKPGVVNALSIEATDNGSLTIVGRARYLG